MTWLVVSRQRVESDDWLEIGAFLIDVWCLGIRSAFADEMSRADCSALLDEQIPRDERESFEPACARKLVEGAVAYAQAIGFLPHRDHRKARRVFGGVEASACAREFVFGREGRPCFVAGPDDDAARVSRVLAVLTGRFGADGFDFIDDAEDEEADAIDAVIEAFYRFIDDGRAPDRTLSAFGANGFLAGLGVLPEVPERDEWMPALWGGAELVPTFRDNLEQADVLEGMLCRLDQITDDFAAAHFPAPLSDTDEDDHVACTIQFCGGVMRALQLRPKILGWLRGHPEAAGAVQSLELIAGAIADAEQAPFAGRAAPWGAAAQEPSQYVGELIAALYARTTELRVPPAAE